MKCAEIRTLLSPCLDGEVTGRQMQGIQEHLGACTDCRTQYFALRQTQSLVSRLGRQKAPPDLMLKLRVALSREAKRPSAWYGFTVRLEDTLRGIMVPAAAGILSAVVMFGLLIGFFALPERLAASDNDVPTLLYTPPQLKSSQFELDLSSVTSDSIVIEAYVDAGGRVQDFRVLSAPSNTEHILPQLNNILIFTEFRPATSFGQPVSGRAILSFAKINVKG